MFRCMTCYWSDVIFIWKESKGQMCSLGVPTLKSTWESPLEEQESVCPIHSHMGLFNSLGCLTARHIQQGERKKEVQGNNLVTRSLFTHTQGLSGDGVDPAVMTSWVILETTRSAISCLSSSMCSPIRGIELSITCHRRQKQQLVRWFPVGRCLFQLASYIN